MGLSSAMIWWDEWKLRILVLCSLSVQFFLYFSALVRGMYILRRLRVMVWIAYISGDALAIYALATLFNRQTQQQTADGSGGNNNTALEVIWAPVLLIHLGGQLSISAYSLQDIELWKRHVITLVSQVTVSLYVFCKWWSGEKRLLQAAVLLFIIGIIRFSQKPWALRRASIRTMAATTNLSQRQRRDERSSSSTWRVLCTFLMEMAQEENIIEVRYSLEEYVKQAQELVNGAKASNDAEKQKLRKNNLHRAIKYVYQIFIDLSSPYFVRLHYLQYVVLSFDYGYGHRMLSEWIQWQFVFMYTKARSLGTPLGTCSFLLLPGLALAPVVLFATSGKDGYNKSDITVTYILFSGTAVLEFGPCWFPLLLMSLARCNIKTYGWQSMVSQHNMMAFCARKKKPTTLMKLAAFSSLRDYINKHWYIWHELEASRISMLVRRHVEYGWKEYIHDAATYRRFSNLRGEQTLRKHHLLEQLLWTFNMPFDEYVLVWHVATDLCGFHYTNTASSQGGECYDSCKIISNHMIYLLFIYPEMLMLGTRQDLFMIACTDIFELVIKDEQPAPTSSSLDERSIAQWILSRIMEQGDDLVTKVPMISNAQKLAKALIDLDDAKMWEVIQGVWVEMLCYSASRSRGYEHANSLADGGECLTNVWLLWSVMGMETLPDKMHNPGPPESSDRDEEQAPSALADII